MTRCDFLPFGDLLVELPHLAQDFQAEMRRAQGGKPANRCGRGYASCAQAKPQVMRRRMHVDVREEGDHIIVQADVPGVSKGDIVIDIEDKALSLSVPEATPATPTPPAASAPAASDSDTAKDCEKAKTQDAEPSAPVVKWHRRERTRNFARREISLPETADVDSIAATYECGVLTVTIGKKELPAKTKRVKVA